VQRRARREEIPQALAVSFSPFPPKLCTQGGVAVGCASVVVESGGAIWLMPGFRGGVCANRDDGLPAGVTSSPFSCCAATETSFRIRASWVLVKRWQVG
jgi:hypothetical protein